MPMPIVDAALIAHRGASAIAPENTLIAVERAAELGATWLETDVRITADGGLVMIHDATLDRTTNGSGVVAHTSLSDILSLDSGSWFKAGFSGERVPTLRQFLQCVLDCGLNLQLELKENAGREEPLVQAVIAELQATWPIGDRGLFLSSFSERCMRLCADGLPNVPRAIATEFVPDNVAQRLHETQCQIIHFQAACMTQMRANEMRDAGVEFAVATVNNPDAAYAFLEMGATSVLSDHADLNI